MSLRLGNLTPEEFADRVGAHFTADEFATLHQHWSPAATLTGPDQFHIFEHPHIAITVGSPTASVIAVFADANARSEFTRPIGVFEDQEWRRHPHRRRDMRAPGPHTPSP